MPNKFIFGHFRNPLERERERERELQTGRGAESAKRKLHEIFHCLDCFSDSQRLSNPSQPKNANSGYTNQNSLHCLPVNLAEC